ncbi:ABC transporter permease [Arvimicrobium flavum]|uniref:ABC transporter permease n=1 Tax=Arvimicrobium flavum TaxID=3393320 RepID=UPI00237B0C2C|nr:ABC transporter permease [Mesorhizobium shangrilense]
MNQLFLAFSRNRAALFGCGIVALVVVTALLAPVIYPSDPLRIVTRPGLWPFTDPRYPLGSDALGRDIAAVMAYGAQNVLFISMGASLLATLIGVVIGAIAGYNGGVVDKVLMRLTEIFQTIPNLIFLIVIVTVLGPKMHNVLIGIGLVTWTGIARQTRGQFLAIKARDFVQASRAVGMSDFAIATREMLPNALPPVVILSSLLVAGAVLFESALSFLGLTDPDVATWGRLIGEGRSLLRTSWYVTAIPGIAIFFTVLALNLIGDGLNDAMNPRLRKRQ